MLLVKGHKKDAKKDVKKTCQHCLAPIWGNCAICSLETLTMLNPQLVAGNTVCFGAMSPKTFRLFSKGFCYKRRGKRPYLSSFIFDVFYGLCLQKAE